jgi:hypothetical protein
VRSAAASYAVELLDRLSPEESENAAAYKLIVRILEQLSGGGEPALALRCYDIKLLEYSGYRPELTVCTVGAEEIRAEDQFFSPARGGAVCPRCASRAEGRFTVSRAALQPGRGAEARCAEDHTRRTRGRAAPLHPVSARIAAALAEFFIGRLAAAGRERSIIRA